jgi:hypothetical protein
MGWGGGGWCAVCGGMHHEGGQVTATAYGQRCVFAGDFVFSAMEKGFVVKVAPLSVQRCGTDW